MSHLAIRLTEAIREYLRVEKEAGLFDVEEANVYWLGDSSTTS